MTELTSLVLGRRQTLGDRRDQKCKVTVQGLLQVYTRMTKSVTIFWDPLSQDEYRYARLQVKYGVNGLKTFFKLLLNLIYLKNLDDRSKDNWMLRLKSCRRILSSMRADVGVTVLAAKDIGCSSKRETYVCVTV